MNTGISSNSNVNLNNMSFDKANESKDEISVVFKNHNFAHDNHSPTLGVKYEDHFEMKDNHIGKIPVKTALAFFNNAEINAGSKTLLLGTSVVTGKLQYDISSKTNLYLKGDLGTISAGVMAGNLSAGIGFRGTVGLEIGDFHIEYFKEENTNNYSVGTAIGLKF